MPDRRTDFFISYTAVDVAWAVWIAHQLQTAGFSTVFQDGDFRGGNDFVHEMDVAVAEADRLIAVWSPDYENSPHAEAEWRPFFKKDPSGERRLILGVRIAPGEPRGLLSTRIAVNLVGLPPDTAAERLAAALIEDCPRPLAPFPGPSAALRDRRRSNYLEHDVRTYAPDELADRPDQWAEMRAFCTSTEGAPYLWWQAKAMAGKTALMATFTLEHELADADVVAFFLRAGLSDPRTSFVAALRDQFAGLVSRDLMADHGGGWQRFEVAGLLNQLAQEWWDSWQRRLVLVVDGLDEDRFVGTEESIAAALPRQPVAGMRVVVTARPQTPVVKGLPRGHPLRDPAVVRPLVPWEHAKDFQEKTAAEIDRLARGSRLEKDVLGLITASGTGLGAHEIAKLLSAWPADVRAVLTGTTGRTFLRVSRPGAGSDGEAFDLGHPELRRRAMEDVGPDRLEEYRSRLHGWAEWHQERDWPADTPAYLLFGYVPMLAEVGDLPRLGHFAADTVRHRRQFDVAGSDRPTLSDIATARGLLAAAAHDLPTLVRLAVHFDSVASRNTAIPVHLPAVWVALGAPARAAALALDIPRAWPRATALLHVAATLAAERPDAARALVADQLTKAIAEIPEPERTDDAQGALVAVLVALGDLDGAVSALDTIVDPAKRGAAARPPVQAMIDRGELVRAEQLLPTVIETVTWKTLAVELVRRAISDGERDIARRVTESAPDDPTRWRLVSECAQAVVRQAGQAGDDPTERAERLGEAKHILGRFIRNPRRRHAARIELVPVVAAVCGAQEAAALVRPIPIDRFERASALAALLRTRVVPDGTERVRWVREQGIRAVDVIDLLTDPDHRVKAVRDVARALVVAAEARWAAELTARITDAGQRVRTRIDLVQEAHACPKALTALCADAEQDLTAVSDASSRVAFAACLVRECATDRARVLRLADLAEAALLSLTGAEQRTATLELVRALAALGVDDRVAGIVRAQHGAPRAKLLAAVADELAAAGRFPAAAEAADSLGDPTRQATVRTALALAAVEQGDLEQAATFAAAALRASRTTTGTQALSAGADLAKALLEAGDPERAAPLARTVTAPQRRASLLRNAAAALAHSHTDRAVELVAEIDLPYIRVRALADLVRVCDPARRPELAATAEALVVEVDDDHQAAALAHLAVAVTASGDRQAGTRLLGMAAERLPTLRDRRTASVIELAQAHLRVDDVTGGLALLQHVQRDDRCAVLSALAAVRPTSRIIRRLLPTAQRIRDPELRAHALARAARTLAGVRHKQARSLLDAATATIRAIADPEQRARTSASLAEPCAAITGDLRRAMRLAAATTQPQLRAAAQLDVVRTLAGQHPDPDLRKQAEAIDLPPHRAAALAAVAEAMSAVDLDGASRLVEQIPASALQAKSFAHLAIAAVAQGRPDDARWLVARALTGDGWPSALVAMAHVEPDALTALADQWHSLSSGTPWTQQQPPLLALARPPTSDSVAALTTSGDHLTIGQGGHIRQPVEDCYLRSSGR